MGNERDSSAGRHGDMDAYAHTLSVVDPLRQPAIRSAIQTLNLPSGSRGLDAGCGIGCHTLRLVEAVAPGGHVTGLDLSPELLVRAKETAKESDLSEHVTFQEGDVNELPFEDRTFDWVWSVDTLWAGPRESGCPAEDPLPLASELARVVKPAGTVAILFWSSQKLLPGYPILEARLNATSSATAPLTEEMKPESHCLRALGWLRGAGLKELTAHTFVADVHAPLSDNIRSALTATFQMLWGEVQSEIAEEDWAQYQRLCEPKSPGSILNLPDYYAFVTYSMFCGKIADGG